MTIYTPPEWPICTRLSSLTPYWFSHYLRNATCGRIPNRLPDRFQNHASLPLRAISRCRLQHNACRPFLLLRYMMLGIHEIYVHIIGLLGGEPPWPVASQHQCDVDPWWWHHQLETFCTLLALCAGNSLVTSEFPSQRPVTWSFDVFFIICAWTNGWVNNRYAGDLRCHHTHYNVIIMWCGSSVGLTDEISVIHAAWLKFIPSRWNTHYFQSKLRLLMTW